MALRIYPFEAVRPKPALAAEVASVPYDVVSRSESRAIGARSANNFIHVVRPDADLPDGVDAYDPAVYAKGRENLERLLREGVLERDGTRRLYLYRQSAWLMGQRQTQTGLVCCCDVRDYDADLIKKHEKTRKDKEDDRVRHVLTLGGHVEPVFLAYQPVARVNEIVERVCRGAALYDFTAEDGVRHAVWMVDGASERELLEAMRPTGVAYVADGHHRSAAASRAAAELRAQQPGASADAEFMRYLAVLFPADQLLILPYHRVVTDLGGMTAEGFVGALGKVCAVSVTDDPAPGRPGSFCVYVGGSWRRCEFPASSVDARDPVGSLDVSLLSERVLGPLLGITDLRTDKRIDFVGGIRGTEELERRVDSGSAAAAFSMHPTTMGQLLAVADAGLMMPPKSTWFEPKLRSGLLIHMLD